MASARVTLTGNNTYASGTVINDGSVVIGNGGGSGSVGFGPVTEQRQSAGHQPHRHPGRPRRHHRLGGVTLINSATVTL